MRVVIHRPFQPLQFDVLLVLRCGGPRCTGYEIGSRLGINVKTFRMKQIKSSPEVTPE